MTASDPLVVFAKRIVQEASIRKIETAVIGGMAVAHHGYIRATADFDLGAYTNLNARLKPLAAELQKQDLLTEVFDPDPDDHLDGMLRVRESAEAPPVEIVNFRNPVGLAAVQRAKDGGDGFRYVRLHELIALKLLAGSARDRQDILALLDANPDVPLGEIQEVCAEFDLAKELARTLATKS